MVETLPPLPSYKKPPVVEVSAGIQLSHPTLTTAHLGAYWARVKARYPVPKDAPGPIIPTVESGSPFEPTPLPKMDVLAQPRLWLANADGDHLLQVQRDRFVSNWKKVPEKDYPRFEQVYGEFKRSFSDFLEYSQSESLQLVPNQFELSYVNHVYEGDGWTKDSGPSAVLNGMLFGQPDILDARLGYPLPDYNGRLHLRLALGRNNETLQRLVLIEITCRGFHKDRDDWFEMAHRAIVTKFSEVTNPEVQRRVWLKEQ